MSSGVEHRSNQINSTLFVCRLVVSASVMTAGLSSTVSGDVNSILGESQHTLLSFQPISSQR